VRKKFADW